LYQRIGSTVVVLEPNIPHPTTTIDTDIIPSDLTLGVYYLKAVDTEGFESEPSNEAICDQACIDKYLSGVEVSPAQDLTIKEVIQ